MTDYVATRYDTVSIDYLDGIEHQNCYFLGKNMTQQLMSGQLAASLQKF